MINQDKRKVCFIITSFIHYSRNFLILEELKKRNDIELHIILGGVVLLERYASNSFNLKQILSDEGYEHVHEAYFNVDGDIHIVKAKTVGLGVIEFSSIFHAIKPDVVLVRGDRFEVLAAVTAAVYMNITVAHIEGGDISGTLDESVRHAITKLAHIHFATNEPAKERILKMGERKEHVFNFGSPDVEVIRRMEASGLSLTHVDFEHLGSGTTFNPQADFLMVMYHPVSTEIETLAENTRNLLQAVHRTGMQTIWFWPNFDAGAEFISHELRVFRNTVPDHHIRFMRYVPPKQFLSLLVNTKCLIGNSSAGIKECSYLGIPVVNVGDRQSNRLMADNVVTCGNDTQAIMQAIKDQLKIGRYPPSHLYVANDTSKEIAHVLAESKLYTQKSFTE